MLWSVLSQPCQILYRIKFLSCNSRDLNKTSGSLLRTLDALVVIFRSRCNALLQPYHEISDINQALGAASEAPYRDGAIRAVLAAPPPRISEMPWFFKMVLDQLGSHRLRCLPQDAAAVALAPDSGGFLASRDKSTCSSASLGMPDEVSFGCAYI